MLKREEKVTFFNSNSMKMIKINVFRGENCMKHQHEENKRKILLTYRKKVKISFERKHIRLNRIEMNSSHNRLKYKKERIVKPEIT